MHRRVIWWSAGALVALVIGCGGGGETKTVTVPADEPAPEGTATADASATPSATPGSDGETPGIAQVRGSVDGDRVQFILTELHRSGPTVILNARIELLGGTDSAQIGSAFNDGRYQKLEDGTSEAGDVLDGVAMVDPEGRKKYLVARDETGACVCSNDLGSQFADEETPVEVTATLTAPPAEVTQIDLLIPHFPTLRDVPITE